jgi:hypothetical protein
MKASHSFDETFKFEGKAKTWSLAMIVIGLVGILYGFLVDGGERAQ